MWRSWSQPLGSGVCSPSSFLLLHQLCVLLARQQDQEFKQSSESMKQEILCSPSSELVLCETKLSTALWVAAGDLLEWDRQYCSVRTWCKLVLENRACLQLFLPIVYRVYKLDWGTGWFRSEPAFLEVRKKRFSQISSLRCVTVHWHGCLWCGYRENTVSAAILGYADINCTSQIKIKSNLNSIKFK